MSKEEWIIRTNNGQHQPITRQELLQLLD
jgi:hypothetical protein